MKKVKLMVKKMLAGLPDKQYLQLYYFASFKRPLNLNNPRTYNEKLQWIKLYDRKPEYTRMVDKYEAKGYIAEKIGPQYVIPTYGVWDSFDEINFDALPDRFIMKTTHDSGTFMICTDKKTFDKAAAKEKMEKSLRRKYYLIAREWPYKNVHPRIICEKLLENGNGSPLSDYKFYCFDGEVRMLHVTFGRGTADGLSMNYYDRDLNLMPYDHYHYPRYNGKFTPPVQYEKMVELASVLSKGIPHVRVDFYEVNGEIYLGELTFFTDGGFGTFKSREFDEMIGSWIKLPEVTK